MTMGENNNIKEIIAAYESIGSNRYPELLSEKSFLKLIEYFEEEDQWEMVLDVAETAISQFLYSVDFYLAKAKALLHLHHFEVALTTLQKAFSLAPSEPAIQLMEVEVFIEAKNFSEARLRIEELKQSPDDDLQAEAYLLEAIIYQKEEQFEAMFYILLHALQIQPSNEALLERFGSCIEITKRYKDSVPIHENLLDQDPYAYLAWYNLGNAHAYLGNYADAIEAYEFAFVIDESFEAACRACAELCFELKLFHKSQKYYLELLELNTADTEIYLRLGQNHFELGEMDSARVYLEKALRYDAQNDELYYALGQTYAAEGQWKKAARYFEKAIDIGPEQEDYLLSMALVLAELEENDLAEAYFLEALNTAPERNNIWIQFALFLLDCNRGEEAIELLEGIEECAEDADVLYCKTACLFAIGNRRAAIYWLGEALEEDFNRHTLLFHFLPELQGDSHILNMISAYIP